MTKSRRALLYSLIVAAFALSPSACTPQPPPPPSPRPTASPGPTRAQLTPTKTNLHRAILYIGEKFDQPGTGQGQYAPVGFDDSLARFLASKLGFQHFQPVPTDTGNREEDLADGSVQMIVATYSMTPDRAHGQDGEPRVDFAGPYMMSDEGILVRSDDRRFQHPGLSPGDLAGKYVCTTTGSVQAEEHLFHGPEAANYDQCIQDMHLSPANPDYADAVYSDYIILAGYAHDNHDYPGLRAIDMPGLGKKAYFGVGLKYGFPGDCRRVVGLLKEYIESPQWDTDFDNYFPYLTESLGEPSVNPYKPNLTTSPQLLDDASFCN